MRGGETALSTAEEVVTYDPTETDAGVAPESTDGDVAPKSTDGDVAPDRGVAPRVQLDPLLRWHCCGNLYSKDLTTCGNCGAPSPATSFPRAFPKPLVVHWGEVDCKPAPPKRVKIEDEGIRPPTINCN